MSLSYTETKYLEIKILKVITFILSILCEDTRKKTLILPRLQNK